jgi:C4-dicarboxylate-specific signal transduction histidine kinase
VLGLALPAGVPALEPGERHGLELYAAQAALALRNAELTATADRQGQTLESARGELVEAAKLLALGHLVSDVVHEVSNLLGAVTLRMEGLLEGPREQPLEGQVHLLQAHCRQIGDLIGELRRFAGAGSWPRAPLDLGASVERILHLRRARMEARGVKVVWERGGRLAEALADRPSLERALLALILESEAAIPANTGSRLTLRLTSFEEAGAHWVRLDVEDDGPPFAPAALQRLFDPFAARGPGRGPSVGLAAAHAVITAHGGRLTAENRRGGGVVLRVELPAAM